MDGCFLYSIVILQKKYCWFIDKVYGKLNIGYSYSKIIFFNLKTTQLRIAAITFWFSIFNKTKIKYSTHKIIAFMKKLKYSDTMISFRIMISLIILFSLQNTIYAQDEVLQFNKTTFDFGNIPMVSSDNVAVFIFEYNGNESITITNVSTSCGCSTPTWPKTPIKKGEKGEIIINYDSNNKIGKFSEKFLVTTNISTKAYELEITGKVDEDLINRYKSYGHIVELGIRIQSPILKFGYVFENRSDTLSLKVYNSSSDIRQIKLAALPNYIKLLGNSILELKAGQIDSFRIILQASKAKSLGLLKGQFNIFVDKTKKATYNNTLSFSAYIKKDVSQLTPEQFGNAPKIEIVPSVIKLSKIESKNEFSGIVKIKNKGKSILTINNIKSNNALLKMSINRKSIRAGKESLLTVKYPDDYKEYKGQDIIYITCNDPKSPVVTVSILKE